MTQKINIVGKDFAGRPIVFENGRISKQAGGSCWLQYGETVVHCAVCRTDPREGIDFFPLTVEYREKTSAAGKIPGGFFKREGRPSTQEILAARMIDRPLRPLFPDGYHDEIQIMVSVFSYDQECAPEIMAINAASAALMASDIPFTTPVAAVKVGILNGEMVVNPSDSDKGELTLELVVAGTEQAVVMIEVNAHEVSEETMQEAIELARIQIKELVEIQKEFAAGSPVNKIEVTPPPDYSALKQHIHDNFMDRLLPLFQHLDKIERGQLVKAESVKIYAELESFFKTAPEYYPVEDKPRLSLVKSLIHQLENEVTRQFILEKELRMDGRKLDEIRQITIETSVLPRTHGSALFTRGQTQALATCTLGSSRDEQIIDSLGEDSGRKKFLLHYNFPSFSVGEVKPIRGVSRREIGHGNLAERAIEPLLPPAEEFPYTVRVTSDIMESNGSSSMATVCSGSLALFDAGVPMKKTASGIAMGLMIDGDSGNYKILTDIAGAEDHCGDMDFKVAGSKDGITALQLDIKVAGLTSEILADALNQAKKARLSIIETMEQVLPEFSQEMSPHAPRIVSYKINPEQIGEVIGKGGCVIKAIQEKSGAVVEIDDDGTVKIVSSDQKAAEIALNMVETIVKKVEPGEVYDGKVVRLMNFGAFVEIAPNKDGLVHISELEHHRVGQVEDVCKIGDEMKVKVIEVDSQGRINLSRKALIPRPEGMPEEPERSSGGYRDRDRNSGSSGSRDHGGRSGSRDHGGRSDYRGGGGGGRGDSRDRGGRSDRSDRGGGGGRGDNRGGGGRYDRGSGRSDRSDHGNRSH